MVARVQVSARLDPAQVKKAKKALGARSITETLQRALALVTEKATHDQVIRRYSGVGRPDAFKED